MGNMIPKNKRKSTSNPVGRPSLYTQELAEEICERIAAGELLLHICKDAHMPVRRTVYNWLRSHEDFLLNFTHAETAAGRHFMEKAVVAADEANDANAMAANVKVKANTWAAGVVNARYAAARNVNVKAEVAPSDHLAKALADIEDAKTKGD